MVVRMSDTLNFETSIRLACMDDLERIEAVERAAYPAPAVPWSREAIASELVKPFSHFFVVTDDETDNIIIAYLVAWLLPPDTHLLNLAVSPEWRGLGYAKKLVRKLIDVSLKAKCERIFLEVRKSNQSAIDLYQSLGFYIEHTRPQFYENGEDAYFMQLNLNQSNKF